MSKRVMFLSLSIAGAILLSVMILSIPAVTQASETGPLDFTEETSSLVHPLDPAPENDLARVVPQTTSLAAAKLRAVVQEKGGVPLIIGVKIAAPFVPEGDHTAPQSMLQQRRAINSAQDILLDSLPDGSVTVYARYKYVPYIALTVDKAGLEALLDLPLVTSVHEDRLSAPLLDVSVPLIGADDAWAAGYDGDAWAVAVLDTGIQWDHEFFGGISGSRVITEACYSRGEDWYNPGAKGSLCAPEPHVASIDVPPCWSWSGENVCGHGTHVAGVAAGSGVSATVAYSGVAPGADIIAIQVFSLFEAAGFGGEVLSWSSDQMLALERVYELSFSHNIAAVNMSLGGGIYTDACDDSPRKAAIDTLRAAGIATIVAAGNGGSTVGVSAPACISSAVAVGGTQDDDSLYWGTNSSDLVDLLAPGVSILSSIPGNDYDTKTGTSFSSPHVAGAWALLKQADPAASVDDILAVLQGTGVDITDARNGVTKPRIQVDAAPHYLTGGVLNGTVREDGGDNPPIAAVLDGVLVRASSPTYTLQATTGVSGTYRLRLPAGTYTVTAAIFGHQPAAVAGVSVSVQVTTTQGFSLAPYTYYTVTGVISDAYSGWPLYAGITVDGDPLGPPQSTFWNDPLTGRYTLTLAGATTYTLGVHTWTAGYAPVTRTIGPLTMDDTQDFALEANLVSCIAPGYTQVITPLVSQDFETWPLSGWSIVDNAGGGCVWYGDDGLEEWPTGNYTGGSGNFADADSWECGEQDMDTELISPPFDASPYDAVVVEFLHDYSKSYGRNDRGDVDIYDGTDWHTMQTFADEADGPARVMGASSAADTRVRFRYRDAYNDYWWQVDEVRIGGMTCVLPTGGGLVVGNVYDNNTGDGLDGATVSTGVLSTTTGATPDPAVGEGFYTLFSLQGSHTFTATHSGYASDVQTPTVPLSDTVRQDFYLEAPALKIAPSSLTAVLGREATAVQTLTFTNTGTLDLNWDIDEYVSWAGVFPDSGTILPGQGTTISVAFDSTWLDIGTYFDFLFVKCNAPANPPDAVPVRLAVTSGWLQGRITEVGSSTPISGALVIADPGGVMTFSDVNGDYRLPLVVYDDYTVTAAAHGYEISEATGVSVSQGVTTPLDFQLVPIPLASVTGTVRDGSGQGWPLYARLKVEGFLFQDVLFTDPANGTYSTTLPQGVPFKFAVNAESGSYVEATRVITPGAAEDFVLNVDPMLCTAPGYAKTVTSVVSEDFEAWPPTGWSIVDNTGSGCAWYGDDGLEYWPEGNLTGGSGDFADADSDECGEKDMDTELISPPFDGSPYEAIRVDFLYAQKTDTGGDTANVDLYDGTSWNMIWTAPHDSLGPVMVGGASSAADTRVRFHYNAYYEYHWQVDEVRITGVNCTPLAGGGLVVGNVYDQATGSGLNGAQVASVHYVTDTVTARATPDDPAVDDGFYTLFSSLTGDRPLEASMPGYVTARQTPVIVAGGVVTQDFDLLPRRHDIFLPVIFMLRVSPSRPAAGRP